MASILSPSNLIRSQDIQQSSRVLISRLHRKKRMSDQGTAGLPNGSFGLNTVLDTMDRFLENNDGNHLVQLLAHLERKTNVSRNALARFLLFIVVCYFLFSIKVFDLAGNVLLYALPSYSSYILLQKDNIERQDLVDLCRYWMFAGFFITIDPALSLVIPFWSIVKIFLAFQCVLPRRSPVLNAILDTVVTPLYRWLQNDSRLVSLNQFLTNENDKRQEQESQTVE